MKKKTTDNKQSLADYLFIRIIITILLCIAIYVCIYFCFTTKGFIPTGVGLTKNDWLSFLGAYLSFFGTVLVSLTVFWHTNYVTAQSEKRILQERKKHIQPVFSIKISTQNTVMEITTSFVDFSKKPPRPSNVIIKIENANEFPITNIIMFDKYISPLLKPCVEKEVLCTYVDPTNTYKFYDSIAVINEEDYKKDSSGLPMWFKISYDDVDGNSMYQIFKLKTFDGTQYYSLDGVFET